jgi:hypothetical protein
MGKSFWHPQEQELLYHNSAVSSACTFGRSACRGMKLSCNYTATTAKIEGFLAGLYELLG